jgi:regulator of cell morphogenesis and NO signaling
MEADLHQHIHLENNILFPRAIELEGHPGENG